MSDRLTPRISYTISGANVGKKRFDFAFKISDDNDLRVVLSDGQTPSGYSVHISKNGNGGYITLAHDLAIGSRITLYRQMSFVRQTTFNENMDFRASVINQEFDRMVMLLQQVGRISKDAIRIPLSDTQMDMVLPNANIRANKVLAFDRHGKVQVRQDISDSITLAKQHATDAKNAQVITDRNKRIITQKLQNMDLTPYAKKTALGTAAAQDTADFVASTAVGYGNNQIPKTDADFKTKTRRAVGNAVLKTGANTYADMDGNAVTIGTTQTHLYTSSGVRSGYLTLSQSLANFDEIHMIGKSDRDAISTTATAPAYNKIGLIYASMLTSQFRKSNRVLYTNVSNHHIGINYVNDSQVYITYASGAYITAIIGVAY